MASSLEVLPLEVQESIIRLLDPIGLISISQACSRFRRIIQPTREHLIERLVALERARARRWRTILRLCAREPGSRSRRPQLFMKFPGWAGGYPRAVRHGERVWTWNEMQTLRSDCEELEETLPRWREQRVLDEKIIDVLEGECRRYREWQALWSWLKQCKEAIASEGDALADWVLQLDTTRLLFHDDE